MVWWFTGPGAQNWWVLHGASMALFWVIILLFLAVIAMRPRSEIPAAHNIDTDMGGILAARTILEERYAKGEIGREEFLNKMRDLEVTTFRAEAGA